MAVRWSKLYGDRMVEYLCCEVSFDEGAPITIL